MRRNLKNRPVGSPEERTDKVVLIFLRLITACFSIFSFSITVWLIFSSSTRDVLREQAVYWFSISLIAAVIPWIKEFKLGDLDIKLQNFSNQLGSLRREISRLSDSRYANLIYLIDRNGSLAMVQRPQYENKWLPCGTRLKPYEWPHQAAQRIILEELGLSRDMYSFWPEHKEITYDHTTIVPKPYQVQLELHRHLRDEDDEEIKAHYDVVYVCVTEKIHPALKVNAKWFSFQEFLENVDLCKGKRRDFTFLDVEKTYEKILKKMGKLPPNYD